MCGDYNDDPGNDFQDTFGGLKDTVEAFGKTWRQGNCPDKVQFSDNCGSNPAMLKLAQNACSPIKNSQECVDDDDQFFNLCVADFCDDPTTTNTPCNTLSAFFHECAATQAIFIDDWKTGTDCEAVPEKCAAGKRLLS